MATAQAAGRHRGRRKQPDPKKAERHLKSILAAQKKRRKLEDDLQNQMDVLAGRIDKAMEDDVPTNRIATTLGLSRQMIYKLVRERVDGKSLGSSKAKDNGKP